MQIYRVTIASEIYKDFEIEVDCINAEKNILTHLSNPNIKELRRKYKRFGCLKFSDEHTTEQELPVHIIMGVADYQRVKKDPGAEFTMLGWTLAGNNISTDIQNTEKSFYMNSSKEEFERMCSIEVLGISDENNTIKGVNHEDFKDQLIQLQDKSYSTRLPWKEDRKQLPRNLELAAARLKSTTKRQLHVHKLEEYDEIMQEQLKDGILEPVSHQPTGDTIHYIPHHAVIKENAETTKLRIVYDCSAKSDKTKPSLNDCLQIGPSLQPLIFDILLKNRMNRYCIIGDIKKAFHQINIDLFDRDVQRLLWYNNLQDMKIIHLRFTKVIFGSGPSPYILGAALEKHLEKYKKDYQHTVKELLENTYVDDIQSGSNEKVDLHKFKQEATMIMAEGHFQLHKWHSNIPDLEEPDPGSECKSNETTYAKVSFGTKTSETKILGIPWDKSKDEISINFEKTTKNSSNTVITKRNILSDINGIFDVLGLVSPVVIVGKLIYSEICNMKLRWDEKVPEKIERKYLK